MLVHFPAFGLNLQASFPLPAGTPAVQAGRHTIALALVDRSAVADWSTEAAAHVWDTVLADGSSVHLDRAPDGTHRLVHADEDVFVINPQLTEVLCAPQEPAAMGWRRFLLDTVLLCVSLLCGNQLLHASAVCIDTGTVGFVGQAGMGKTSLAIALCARGADFVCDDVLALEASSHSLWAHPGPGVVNLPRLHTEGHRVGSILAEFPDEDEVWVKMHDHAMRRTPLRSIYVIERSARAGSVIDPRPSTALDLLPEALALNDDTHTRRSRFDFYSDVADKARVLHLARGSDASPGDLADLVLATEAL